MKKIFTISIGTAIVIFLTGCSKDPVANFAYSPADPYTGEQVSFDNLSMDAESCEWNFGDGTMSTVWRPVHTYLSGGTYTVTLKAFGKRSGMDVYSMNVNVTSLQPQVEFGVYTDLPGEDGPIATETDIVFVGEQVEFYNTSVNALSYLWDFGDGYTSDLESPVLSYDTPGVYEITLTGYGAGNEQDTYSTTIEVVEGVNSALRITVLDVDEDYLPVAGASVIIFETYDDWYNFENELDEVFTTVKGKCVYEGLEAKRYYVDAFANDDYNNSGLGVADPGWVETQLLEPDYIHDFFAYIEYTGGKKSVRTERVSSKRIDLEASRKKKLQDLKTGRINKYSKAR
ncbi:MAG: PKD domain-containing protein [Bacteroidales bacterium]|nr:PKD domain-containing protein [Bacteroidales bacterium]